MDIKRIIITLKWLCESSINSFIDKIESAPTLLISTDFNLLQSILQIEDRKLNMNMINFIIYRKF